MMKEPRKYQRKHWKEYSLGAKIAAGIVAVCVGGSLAALFGYITMQLWNWIMPKFFHLPEVNYWEAWGVLLLSHILFRGHRSRSRYWEWRRKRRLRARLQEMAEREMAVEKEATGHA